MSSSAENASPKSRMKDVRQNTVFASEPPPPSKARASLRRTLTQLRGVQKAKKAFLNNRIVRKYLPHGPTYLDQDASEKVKRTRTAQCVLLPHSKMYIAWDILVSFLVVWNIFYLPIAIAFPDDLHMFLEENKEYLPIRFKIGTCEDDDDSACLYYIDSIIDFISDTVFIADIIICCRTVIIEEVKGRTVEIHDAQVIFRRYLTGFFFLDILGVGIPYTDFWVRPLDRYFGGKFQSYKRYVDLLGFFKFFRIAKLDVIFKRFVNVPPNYQDYVKFVKIVLYLLITNNLFACVFYYVACDDNSNPKGDSWVETAGLMNANIGQKWLTGFYFTLFTMMSVGYGSPAPSLNTSELLGALVIMVGGVMFFSVMAGNFISTMHGISSNSTNTTNQLYDMHVFAKSRNLPKKMQDDLRASIISLAQVNRTSCSPKEFLNDVPSALQRKMFETTRTRQLMEARIFIPCGYAFVQAVSRQMDTMVFPKGSYVTRAGDINNKTNSLIIMRSGVAEIFGFDDKTVIATVIGMDREAQAVGLANGFVENIRRLFTVSAKTNLACFSLECNKLKRLFVTHREALAPVLQHVIEDLQMRFEKARENLPVFKAKRSYHSYRSAQEEHTPTPTAPACGQIVRQLSTTGDKVMRGYKLAVRVYEARHMDKLGGRLDALDEDPDIYIVVRLLDSRERTQLAYDTANPFWDELLLIDAFAFAQPEHTLAIDIMEANFFLKRDVLVGQLIVSVADIMKGKRVDGWYKVPPIVEQRRGRHGSEVVPIDDTTEASPLLRSTSEDEPAVRLSLRVIGSYFSEQRRAQEIENCIAILEKKKKEALRSVQIYNNWLNAQQDVDADLPRESKHRERASLDNRR